MKSSVKLMAKAPKPRIVCISSPYVLGTSSETTGSVMANPNTASLRPSVRETSWVRQRNFLLSPIFLSISFSRTMFGLVRSLPGNSVRCQRLLDHALDLRGAARRFEPNEALDQLSVAIIYERLRYVLIIAQQLIDQIIIGIGEWLLNSESFRKAGNLSAIVFAAHIQADDLQPFIAVLLLKIDQVWRFRAARLAPSRIKVQHYHLALKVRELCALVVFLNPTA